MLAATQGLRRSRPAEQRSADCYNTPVRAFFVQNFGCRATQADGAAIERQLVARGFHRAETAEQADLLVLNTCTVTAAADQDARAAIRKAQRENPTAKVLVTGCYAQRAPQEVAALPGVNWVVGNSHKHQVADIVASDGTGREPGKSPFPSLPANPLPLYADHASAGLSNLVPVERVVLSSPPFTAVGDIFAHTELMAAPVFTSDSVSTKTRPNLKVQDGCNNRCSFCIIPSVRGASRSLPLESVLRETQALVAAGYREVVLSGINLGRWGRDFQPQLRLEQLLRSLLEHTDIEKIRISSVEPMDWSDELIGLAAGSPRIAKHAHIPLQSGSDHVLRLMRRKYRPWHYAEKLRKIHEAMPEAAIGADVMVGFPGETAELFEENRSFIEKLPFTYLHVFTYSSRPGTPSAAMPDQIPVGEGRARNRILRDLAAQKNLEFRQRFVGRELKVITLQAAEERSTEALTDNYLKVEVTGHHPVNTWMQVEVKAVGTESLIASRVCSLS